jgi:hypothetical protein
VREDQGSFAVEDHACCEQGKPEGRRMKTHLIHIRDEDRVVYAGSLDH